jgi:hypothetical protein
MKIPDWVNNVVFALGIIAVILLLIAIIRALIS